MSPASIDCPWSISRLSLWTAFASRHAPRIFPEPACSKAWHNTALPRISADCAKLIHAELEMEISAPRWIGTYIRVQLAARCKYANALRCDFSQAATCGNSSLIQGWRSANGGRCRSCHLCSVAYWKYEINRYPGLAGVIPSLWVIRRICRDENAVPGRIKFVPTSGPRQREYFPGSSISGP